MTDRCPWCGTDPLYVAYHDAEWGVPERNPRALWENLVLEGFQAGLSWITILRKRDTFRAAFAGFDPAIVAGWGAPEVARLMADPGIVRHRGKIEGAIRSARAFLTVEAREGFVPYVWRHADSNPARTAPRSMADIPAETPASRALSKQLKKDGFAFCGPKVVYAFMQASGLVNDHLLGCSARARAEDLARRPPDL